MRFKKIFMKLLVLAVIAFNLPVTVYAKEGQDILRQVDGLTNGLNEDELIEVKRFIDEKLEAARNRQGQTAVSTADNVFQKGELPAEKRLKLEFKTRVFFYNLEGSNLKFRNTRTFFGDIVEARLSYKLGDNAKIRAGVTGILPFSEFDLRWGDYYRDFQAGDHSNKRVDLVQPYLQLRYDYQNFGFIFGDLETPHDFHKLLVYDVYEFLRPTEKGLQILYENAYMYQDLFINWREKNTPGNHERFNIGSISKLKWQNGSLAFQALYVHRGGHEFPQKPIVFENISAALVFDHSIPVKKFFIDRIGIELASLYTNDLPPGDDSTVRVDGFGALGSFYLTSGDWRLKSGYWRGTDDVLAEEGIPFSQKERFVYSELTFNKRLKNDVNLQFLITVGKFGRDLKEIFFDQKLVVSWRHDFGLGF